MITARANGDVDFRVKASISIRYKNSSSMIVWFLKVCAFYMSTFFKCTHVYIYIYPQSFKAVHLFSSSVPKVLFFTFN